MQDARKAPRPLMSSLLTSALLGEQTGLPEAKTWLNPSIPSVAIIF